MGLFCGKTCKCKRRCKSYFPGIPPLEDACKNACKEDSGLDRDSFLCSGRHADQQSVMLQLGYDPCLGDEIVFGDTLAGQAVQQNAKQWHRLQPIMLLLGFLIVIGLGMLYLKSR